MPSNELIVNGKRITDSFTYNGKNVISISYGYKKVELPLLKTTVHINIKSGDWVDTIYNAPVGYRIKKIKSGITNATQTFGTGGEQTVAILPSVLSRIDLKFSEPHSHNLADYGEGVPTFNRYSSQGQLKDRLFWRYTNPSGYPIEAFNQTYVEDLEITLERN